MAVAPALGRVEPLAVDQHAAVAQAELVAMRLDGCDHARSLE